MAASRDFRQRSAQSPYAAIEDAPTAGAVILVMVASARGAVSTACEAELRRAMRDMAMGASVEQALGALNDRVGSKDFDWVVQAITIHREVGGDLAEILDSVGATIRERNHLRRQIKALSAEGRLSAGVLLALPFVVFVAIRFLQPTYIQELTGSPVGWLFQAAAGVLMAVGTIWIRKIVKLVY
jgi:tight adherence protein B